MTVSSHHGWIHRAGPFGSLFRRRGPGPRILILPGLGCPATEYLAPASEHLPTAWDIEVWEGPGAGRTPFRGPGQSTVDDLVRALAVVMDSSEGSADPFVVGHSLGGLVGLLLCERQPARVAGFVNVEGNLGPGDCVFTRGAAELDRRRFESEWLPAVIERLARAPTAGERHYATVLSDLRSPEAYHRHSRSIAARSAEPDLVRRFLRLPVPTLYVHGAASGDGRTLERLRGRCEMESLPDAGHFPHIDRPAAFWALVRRWMEEVARTASGPGSSATVLPTARPTPDRTEEAP